MHHLNNYFKPKESSLYQLPAFTCKSTATKPDFADLFKDTLSFVGDKLKEIFDSPPPSVDHCPLSDEEITSFSVLDTLPISEMPANEAELALRVAGNFVGGGLVTGGMSMGKFAPVDGIGAKHNYLIWDWLLNEISKETDPTSPDFEPFSQIKTGIKQLIEFTNEIDQLAEGKEDDEKLFELALKYANKVKELKPGEFQVFHGGWLNQGGGTAHGLIYEIERNEDMTLDLFIYTSTGFQLSKTLFTGGKTLLQPVIHYAQVPESEILFNQDGEIRPIFIQHIIEIYCLHQWMRDRVVNEEDVLEIFDHISEYREDKINSPYGFITAQRGGTCGPSATKQWIRKRSNHLEFYKQLMFHAKFRLTVATYHSVIKKLPEISPVGEHSRRALRYFARNLLRESAKMVHGISGSTPLMDTDSAYKVEATLFHLLKNVAQCEQFAEEKIKSSGVDTLIDWWNLKDSRDYRASEISKINTENVPFVSTPSNQILPDLRFKISSIDDLIENIKVFEKLSSDAENHYSSHAIRLFIYHIVDQLPIPTPLESSTSINEWLKSQPSKFWQSLSVETMKKALEKIEVLIVKGSPYLSNQMPARQHATWLPLYTIAHFITLKMDSECKHTSKEAAFAQYKILDFSEIVNDTPAMVYYDRFEFERFQQASQYLSYFNDFAKGKVIFSSEKNTEIKKFKVDGSRTNGVYWQALLNDHEKLMNEVNSEAEYRWKDLTEDEIEKDFQKNMLEFQSNKFFLGKPRRKVNLPKKTKQCAILEEVGDEHPLERSGFGHILTFRKIIFSIHHSFQAPKGVEKEQKRIGRRITFNKSPKTSPIELTRTARRSSAYDYEVEVNGGYFKRDQFLFYAVKKIHRPIENKHKKLLEKILPIREKGILSCNYKSVADERHLEHFDEPLYEGEVLTEESLEKKFPVIRAFLRTAAEWRLSPAQMLYELKKDLEKLKKPSFQALFFRLFFRSPVEKIGKRRIPYIGFGDLILEDHSLINMCEHIIYYGLNYYHSQREDDGVLGGHFFFELAFFIAKYLKDGEKLHGLDTVKGKYKNFILTAEINRWVEDDKLSENEKYGLVLFKILNSSFKEIPELSHDDLIEIYSSWIQYKMAIGESQNVSPYIKDYTAQFMIKLTEFVIKNLEDTNELCSGIMRKLNFDPCDLVWTNEGSATVCRAESPHKEVWQIDLIRGKFYTPKGLLGSAITDLDWEDSSKFIRLFPNENNFKYRSEGSNCISFTHPDFGPFKIILEPRTIQIHRKFPGHKQWFKYHKVKRIFGILGKDHAFWVPIENPIKTDSDAKITGFITTLKDQEIRFATTDHGTIIEVDQKGEITEKSRFVDTISDHCEGKEHYCHFDKPSHILCYKDREEELIQEIHFAAYSSVEDNPLKFYRNEAGKFLWSENEQYYLPSTIPEGLFGSIRNYLYVKKIGNKKIRKLIVPFQPIKTYQSTVVDATLKIFNKQQFYPQKRGAFQEHWGIHKYFVFNVVNGDIQPATIEGRLFFSYLLFSQRKYEESVRLLKSLKPTDTLSDTAILILQKIMTLKIGEDHPDAKAISLRALHLWMKEQDHRSIEFVKSYFYKLELSTYVDILKTLTDALESLNNISFPCRLTREEELYLISRLIRDYSILKDRIKRNFYIDQNEVANNIAHLELRKVALMDKDSSKKTMLPLSDGLRNFPNTDTPRRIRMFSEGLPFDIPAKPYKPKPENYKHQSKIECKGHYCCISTYNEAKQTYLESLACFEEAISRKRNWLQSGKSIRRCTRPPAAYRFDSNGHYFLEIYRIAFEGTKAQKRPYLYQMMQWHLRNYSAENFNSSITSLLCRVLVDRREFPKPIDDKGISDDDILSQFFDDLRSAYKYSLLSWNDVCRDLKGLPLKKSIDIDQPENLRYPVLDQSILYQPPKKAPAISPKCHPLTVDLQEDPKRWSTLKEWEKYTSVIPDDKLTSRSKVSDKKGKEKSIAFEFSKDLISKEEEDFCDAFINDLKELDKDFSIGAEERLSTPTMTITDESAKELRSEVKETISSVSTHISKLEKALIDKATPKSVLEQLLIGGKAQKTPTFSLLVSALLSQDEREFRLMNERMDNISDIAKETLKILDLKSYIAQLERIESALQKILHEMGADTPKREYLCQKLHSEITAKTEFDRFSDDVQIALRVFSGETGMIPYQKQLDVIEKMLEMASEDPEKFKDIVIQLIMGGGKTSVIATIILYLAAKRKDRLGLFVVPDALFHTVKQNLSDGIYQAFQKHIHAIHLTRDKMTSYKLEESLQVLTKANKSSEPLITTTFTLQSFELEMLSEMRDLRDSLKVMKADREELEEQIHKIFLLAGIHKTYSDMADGLLDEIDLLLACLKETNFPAGEKIAIQKETNELLFIIFKTLTSDQIIETLPDRPKIIDFVRLTSNKQSNMDEKLFIKHVIPIIANQLADEFEPFSSALNEFSNSLIRYISGIMPNQIQTFADNHRHPLSVEELKNCLSDWDQYESTHEIIQDINFLRYLDELHHSKNKNAQNIASLAATARHILIDILKATLSKSGKRNYGLSSPDSSGLNIIPYLAVNSPASTQFGYFIEEACYYYQWASSFNLKPEDIRQLAETYIQSARYYVEKNEEKIEETIEYQEFYRIFGVAFDQLDKPDQMQKALSALENDRAKRMEIVFEIVAKNVTFNTERLNSNGMGLVDQLSTRRTMSGTPHNVKGYNRKLATRYVPDFGTEGKILHRLAQILDDDSIHIHDFETIDEFMGPILEDHSSPDKIRGIIEAGGIFKIFKDNAEVAKQLTAYIRKKQKAKIMDPRIQAVLFYHYGPGQSQPDTLYAWKIGAPKPTYIGGSSQERLKAKGFDTSSYFVYYDERHTTGCDILQEPDATNLFTYDESMTTRTIGQGSMRLRQLLFHQKIEVVMTKSVKEKVFGDRTITAKDLFIHSEKVQSLKNTKHLVRYFRHQIDSLYRREPVRYLRDLFLKFFDEKEFITSIDQFEAFFVTKMSMDMYECHGRLKSKGDTKEILLNQLAKKHNFFKSTVTNEVVLKKITKEEPELRKYIQSIDYFPAKWEQSDSLIGLEQEVEVETEVEVEVEVNVEIEEEVEQELELYNQISRFSKRYDDGMSEKVFLQLANHKIDLKETIYRLQDILSMYPYGYRDKKWPFSTIFEQPIYGTENFFFASSKKNLLPFFHRAQKPAKQILVIENLEGFKWICVSEKEANDIKQHIQKHKDINGVWLIQPDGTLLVDNSSCEPLPIEDELVSEGLLEINALAGHATYLDKNRDQAKAWFTKNKEVKLHFLKLKTAKNKKENQVLRTSAAILTDQESESKCGLHFIKLRAEQEKNKKGKFCPLSNFQTKTLPPKHVRVLHIDYVPYLGIDIVNSTDDDRKALEVLRNKHPEKSEEEINEIANKLIERQFAHLQPFHVPHLSIDQIKWLPDSLVRHIKHPRQIYSEVDGKPVYMLSREQAKKLRKVQSSLIPYLNPDYYADFSEAWQTQAVPPKYVHLINPEFWIHLTQPQVQAISFEEGENVPHLKIREKYSWLKGNLIEFIPNDMKSAVTPEQIRSITKIELIPQLVELAENALEIETGTWTSWITPEMVQHITEKQVEYLINEEQIQKVQSEFVQHLSSSQQVPFISSNQVPYLSGIAQIQACPKDLVDKLTKDQVHSIQNTQVPFLKGEQISWLEDETLFSNLVKKQMPSITIHQFPMVIDRQISGLTTNQLLEFSRHEENWKSRLKHLSKEQIHSFDSKDLIDLLSENQIRDHLLPEQVPYLTTKEQIQACQHVAKLSQEQVSFISEAQVPKLTLQQIKWLVENKEVWKKIQKHLTARQVQQFNSSELIALLNEEQMKVILKKQYPLIQGEEIRWIQKKYIPFLNQAQIKLLVDTVGSNWIQFQPFLSQRQIQQFDTEEKVSWISSRQIHEYLEPHQVKYLTTQEQIQACPHVSMLRKNQIQHVSKEQVPKLNLTQIAWLIEHKEAWEELRKHLTPDQIQSFETKQLVKYLDNDQIRWITNNQVRYVSKKHVPALDKDKIWLLHYQRKKEWEKYRKGLTAPQIQEMDDRSIINDLGPEQINHLKVSQLSLLKDKNLRFAQQQDQIRSISYSKVEHLTRDQLKKRSWSQFLVYTIGVVALGVLTLPFVLLINAVAYPILKLTIDTKPRKAFFARINQNQRKLYRLLRPVSP